ncbi:MAG: polysaccharide deacetylase family protein [Thermotaleaceae bacterium]
MKNYFKLIAITLILIFALIGCSKSQSNSGEREVPHTEETMKELEAEVVEEAVEIDLQKVKPNEAGQIMVLMYHNIAEPEGEWTRTPENFRKDLETLYEKGYRPISLKDYVTGNITTEAGFTPVVLTFDDGWQNNFNLIENEKDHWVIDPQCAVGILQSFHEEHPDFPLKATFFINDNIPFGQKEHLDYKLKYLVEKGMDIGNHTATHVNFTNVDGERIQKELAGIVELVKKTLPDYEIDTLALPFGSKPKDKSLLTYLEKGVYGRTSYHNIGVLEVGWDPYKSPYHKDFNPLAIHRVRASDLEKYVKGVGLYDWLDQFEKGSRVRYISDGDPNTVTIPENYLEIVDSQKVREKKIRTYQLEK